MGLFGKKRDVSALRAGRDFEGLAHAVVKGSDAERREAAAALTEIGDPAAIPALIGEMGRLRASREGYAAAVDTIVSFGAAAVDPLTALIRRQDGGALHALSELGDDVALPPLTELSADADPEVRELACGALARMGTPAAHEVLARRVEEAGPPRLEAAKALRSDWKGGDERLARAVFSLTATGDAELAEIGKKAATNLVNRARAGETDSEGTIVAIVEATRSPDADTRLMGAAGLNALLSEEPPDPDPRLLNAGRAELDADEEPVRVMGAIILAFYGDEPAVALLIELMRSGNDWVAISAIEALRRLKPPEALPVIRAWVKDGADTPTSVRVKRNVLLQELIKEEKRGAKAA